MVTRILVLVACVASLAGCDKLNNVVSKFRTDNPARSSLPAAPPAEAPPAPPATDAKYFQAAQLADAQQNDEAINLAKNADTLVQGYLYAAKPDPATITNEAQIQDRMSRVKGDIAISGWSATKSDYDTYLVTYSFNDKSQPGTSSGWAFEVKLSEHLVRNVLGDPALEKKYGWGVPR